MIYGRDHGRHSGLRGACGFRWPAMYGMVSGEAGMPSFAGSGRQFVDIGDESVQSGSGVT